MDRRIYRTRKAIMSSFNELLLSKKYNQITVNEITNKANIGRSTFYSHFETKDYLLYEICNDLFDHVFNNEINDKHKFFKFKKDSENKIYHILYHINENNKKMNQILSCESSEIFIEFLRKKLDSTLANNIINDIKRKNYTVNDDFLINHISGSFINMLEWWVKDNFETSTETISKYFFSVIENII